MKLELIDTCKYFFLDMVDHILNFHFTAITFAFAYWMSVENMDTMLPESIVLTCPTEFQLELKM